MIRRTIRILLHNQNQSCMNQLFISFFITGAVSVLVFIVLLLIAITLQFRKQHSFCHNSFHNLVAGFHNQLIYAEVRAQEAVFRMISREIHDNIGLSLTTIKLFLYRIGMGPQEEANMIRGSINMLSRVIDQLRHICRGMNGDVLEDQGLVNALQQEIERINQLNQIRIVMHVEGEQVNFDSSREVIVLRMIQESINNILKHARAQNAEIRLGFTDQVLCLQIKDDGIGIGEVDEKKAKGSGLINLYKRATLLNGECSIKANIPRGTIIDISVPVQNLSYGNK